MSKSRTTGLRTSGWQCVDVVMCKYVASCTYFSWSTGAIFREVSDRSLGDAGLCFPPMMQPKDVLIAGPDGWQFYDFTCGNWNYHSEENDYICNWVDDPDFPDPDPGSVDPAAALAAAKEIRHHQ
ncbi:hypothetical protein MKQ70_32145 [Chitinophaga sedimenti]|uniref:hypothetical protein n=1 Tax=Chitinophaga sedimenti TaxID=2033606 RepID=UPI00200391F6|nr:hypothetical protein [Chitinophaga sedimenti]MCK7559370.1 hypothetical protein [Chitinophaga sedimenti]